jgi:protein-tyrosine phosphatase
MTYDEVPYDHIGYGLYISDIDSIPTSPNRNLDLVVSVCQDTVEDNVGCVYQHYPLADDPESQQNWGGSYHYDEFSAAADAVYDALCHPHIENVLVHCHKGRNRSAAVCAAALGRYAACPYHHALSLVEDARPIADPNEIMASHARHYIEQYE